jgi:hypothetical protein
MEKGRANLSRLPEAPIAKVIKDILGLWEVDCGIADRTAISLTAPRPGDKSAMLRELP